MLDDGEDDEHNDVDFMDISKIIAFFSSEQKHLTEY